MLWKQVKELEEKCRSETVAKVSAYHRVDQLVIEKHQVQEVLGRCVMHVPPEVLINEDSDREVIEVLVQRGEFDEAAKRLSDWYGIPVNVALEYVQVNCPPVGKDEEVTDAL
jgi:hypothetical protein